MLSAKELVEFRVEMFEIIHTFSKSSIHKFVKRIVLRTVDTYHEKVRGGK